MKMRFNQMVARKHQTLDYVTVSAFAEIIQYKPEAQNQSFYKINKTILQIISTIGFSLFCLEKGVVASELIKQNNNQQIYLANSGTIEVPVTEILEAEAAIQVVTPPDTLVNLNNAKVPAQETSQIKVGTSLDNPIILKSAENLEITAQKTLEPRTQTEVFTEASLLQSETTEPLQIHAKHEVVTPPEKPISGEITQNLETPVQDNSNPQLQPEVTTPQENPRTDFKSFVTVYGGTGTNSSLGEALTLQTSKFYDSFFNNENFIGIEGGRKLASNNKNLSLEALGQLRQHIGERGYLAVESALVLRWNVSPNSNFLNTSLAIGNGLSYVTALPGVEETRPTSFNKSNLLNFLLIESTFSLPKSPEWSLVLRLNHRSGVFGLFNGVRDGSNNFALGIRRSF